MVSADSMVVDSTMFRLNSMGVKVSRDTLEATVTYSAKDSMIYDVANSKVHLYGDAMVSYKDIKLNADYVQFDWGNSTVTAETRKDENGQPVGYADFSEGSSEYHAHKIMYNFQSKKGKVFHVKTNEGEGYIHGEEVKKNEYDEWFARDGKYTTCNLDHPHFYIHSNRLKMVPDKVLVTGAANLVVEDIPTPLYIPFGIFPVQQGQRSGVILPEYGEEVTRGFFLRNGGYYFGMSDYVDLALTGDLYSKGSWGATAASSYKKRYRFGGRINLRYGRNRFGDPEEPDFAVANDFRVEWQHSQDPKARPNSNFAANVNFGTSTYDKNFSFSQERVLNSVLTSNVVYTKSWPNKPFTFTTNLRHDQNLNTGSVNLSLPSMNFSVARIQPFKRKQRVGGIRWYEKIGFNYSLDADNRISGVDSTFFQPETFEQAKYGFRHSVPVSTSFKLFKYFTLAPGARYTERWYFKTVEKLWDPAITYVTQGDSIVDTIYGQVIADTISGFKAARDFSLSTALSTRVYGQLNFRNSKLKAIRHVLTPSLDFTYRPDFSEPFWGNYRTVQTDTAGNMQQYSIFEPAQSLYGAPAAGRQASIGLRLTNNLEMKVFSRKDTLKQEKKIRLIENLAIAGSYNLAADSLNMSNVSISGYTTLFDKIRLNVNTSFDPYAHDSNNTRINTYLWDEQRKLARMSSAGVTLNADFQSKRNETLSSATATEEERRAIEQNPNAYYDFTIPWRVTTGYNLNFTRGVFGNPDTLIVSANSLTLDMDINLTPKWKLNMGTGYDFAAKDLVLTDVYVVRDLHCWELKFRWVAYPVERQSYSIELNVKSPVLQDLKLSKRQSQFDNVAF